MTDIEMSLNIELAKTELAKDGTSLVIIKNGEIIFTSGKSGVDGLMDFTEIVKEDEGLFLGDRIIGLGAAYLGIYAGISAAYTPVITEGAEKVFGRFGVGFVADATVPHVINRTGDGRCPIDTLLESCQQPAEARQAILGFRAEMAKAAGR